MAIEVVKTSMFMCQVRCVEIIRLKSGSDKVFLRTNLKNPCYPYAGTLSLQTEVTRGTGEDWARKEFPGVEFHLFDNTLPVQAVPRQISALAGE